MLKAATNQQRGASIMELVIVLAIALILLVFAAAQFGRSGENLHRQNIARDLKVSLERARFDSVKRRPSGASDMSKVTILSATSFSYTTDFNQNGQIDEPGETRVIDFATRGDVKIVPSDPTFPITVRFDARGHITTTNGASTDVTPLFYVCNGECTSATAHSGNSNIIYVSPTGTVAMMKGGETVPTFGNPAVTNVNSNSSVNPLLAVWDDTAAASTPAPTPAATPTPTPTPTPTTPTPTPSPTPAPVACTYGQRPASTGCVCVAPRWVRANGKCQ